MGLFAALAVLGSLTGFLSGLVGIGGGIIMAPLLLFVPPLLGLPPLSMKTVAGLTIVQGFVASLSGTVAHHRFRFVSGRLAVWMGPVIFVTAAAGGAGSDLLSDWLLLAIFAVMALIAGVLILLPARYDHEAPDTVSLGFSRLRALATASGVGFFGGLVGQGGSFILIPLMTSFVRIPTRIALGSNLAIVLLSSTAALIGKAVTGQIEWLLALPIVLTVVPAAQVGSLVSRKAPVSALRRVLAVVILLAAVRIGISAIRGL